MILLLKVSSGPKADKINAKWAAVVINFVWLMATQRKTARRRHKGYVPHANLRLRKVPPYNSFCILPNLCRRWKWQIIWAFTPHGDTNVFLCPALNNTGPSATELWPRMYGCVPRAPHPSQARMMGLGWHSSYSQEHHGVCWALGTCVKLAAFQSSSWQLLPDIQGHLQSAALSLVSPDWNPLLCQRH